MGEETKMTRGTSYCLWAIILCVFAICCDEPPQKIEKPAAPPPPPPKPRVVTYVEEEMTGPISFTITYKSHYYNKGNENYVTFKNTSELSDYKKEIERLLFAIEAVQKDMEKKEQFLEVKKEP